MAVERFKRLILGTNIAGTDNGDGSITLEATGGVTTLAKNGSTGLQGDVTLSAGAGVALNQVANDIAISATAAAGSSVLLYDYVVAGSDKASIDTNVDGAMAALFSTGYLVLEVWAVLRTDEAVINPIPSFIVNNDTSSIYDREVVRGTNATAAAASALAGASWQFQAHGSSGLSGQPSMVRLTIPNYAGTTFNKIGEMVATITDSTAANNIAELWSVGYRSTSAITRIKLAAAGATKFKVGTRLMVFAR